MKAIRLFRKIVQNNQPEGPVVDLLIEAQAGVFRVYHHPFFLVVPQDDAPLGVLFRLSVMDANVREMGYVVDIGNTAMFGFLADGKSRSTERHIVIAAGDGRFPKNLLFPVV